MKPTVFIPKWVRQQFINALIDSESCGRHYNDPNHCNCKAYHTNNYNKMKKKQLIAIYASKSSAYR